VAAVAFESLVKLVILWRFCHLRLFDGFGDLFSRAAARSCRP
jgi:hypothetical protein